MHGEKLYQQRARSALPLLVRQAEFGCKILYSNLAQELGMPNPRNLNYVLGSIGQSLMSLAEQSGMNIPPIQCLVVNKSDGLPGEGIGWFLDQTNLSGIGRKQYATLPSKEKRLVVEKELAAVFNYSLWGEVLRHLGLDRAGGVEIEGLPLFFGGGESDDHRALKEFVKKNPALVGVRSTAIKSSLEFPLLSGDFLDVSFLTPEEWVAVEVKSKKSDVSDVRRGIYQCVKYGAVQKAMGAAKADERNVRAVLVLEGKLPSSLMGLRNLLGVEVVEDAYHK
ncbi:hypothetical protein [Octadecabacter sp. B2R22]|nr:hypothetical protein [Octadecabacter sp. B2R22]